jgi:hypothetical protein
MVKAKIAQKYTYVGVKYYSKELLFDLKDGAKHGHFSPG